MTIDDLKELLDYIMKNNSWKEFSYLYHERKQPKYIDVKVWFTLDTSFRVENKKDLQRVYKWLDDVRGVNNEQK